MRRLLLAIYAALVSIASCLFGSGKPAHHANGLRLRRRSRTPGRARIPEPGIGDSLGLAELGIVRRVQLSVSGLQENRPVVVLVLDLSRSIEAIAAAYAKGYRTFLDGLVGVNPTLVLLGFDSSMRLLYCGPLAEAPRYSSVHFTSSNLSSILGKGTGLYRAIVTASLLATELQRKFSVTINWLTDGLDSRGDEVNAITLPMAVAACRVLQRLKLPYQVIGIQNTKFSNAHALGDLLRMLNPPLLKDSAPDVDLSQTMPTGRAFLMAAHMVQESINPGSSRTEIHLPPEEVDDDDRTIIG